MLGLPARAGAQKSNADSVTLGKLKARAKKPDRTARSPLVSNRDIKGISVRDSDDNDDVLVEWAAIGAAVLAAQRIEFLL